MIESVRPGPAGLASAVRRRAASPVPLVGFSWDLTTEHAALAAATEQYLPWAQTFMVGPFAGDRASIDMAIAYCEAYDLAPLIHTLDLDLAGVEPLDLDLLRDLRECVRRLGVSWVTTDLAVWMHRGQPLVDNLMAILWVPGVVEHVVARLRVIQDVLGVRVAVENSAYGFGIGDLNPFAVQAEIAQRADAWLCFDVGHTLITAEVTGRDVAELVPDDFPWELVVEAHVAGVTTLPYSNGFTSDDQHGAPITDRICALAERTLSRAENLVVWVAESESIKAPDLARKVERMHREVRRWKH